MFLTPGMLLQAILFGAAVYWCKEMFGKWREHRQRWRDAADSSERASIAVLWLITLLAVIWVVRFVFVIGARILEGLRELA